MTRLLPLLAVALSGCFYISDADQQNRLDGDGDGVRSADDCDDADPTVSATIQVYADGDGDGWGAGDEIAACRVESGFADLGGDCDDADAARNPLAAEICDPDDRDEDCDGASDDDDPDVTGTTAGYADLDGDGFGGDARAACDGDGLVDVGGDCDDADEAVNPDAIERCDATDSDCDGQVDDDDPDATGHVDYHPDGDGDGFGDASITVAACSPPEGMVADDTDCDDGDPATNPGAAEVCDAFDADEDCDGQADDADGSALGATRWNIDGDGDGFGSSATVDACNADDGLVLDASDCDDADAAINPAAAEICDAADDDEDCDGAADDADSAAGGATSWFADGDGDGFGGLVGFDRCDGATGIVAVSGDCDDGAADIHPGAVDTPDDTIDQDCDGVDDTLGGDLDADGYDDVADGGTDCDDADAAIHPGATELPYDGIDQDCADGDLVDVDGDGEASAVVGGADCDDLDPAINKGATEVPYDDIDQDCDGTDLVDVDADGFDGDVDCDDADPSVFPGMVVDVPADYATIQGAIDAVCDGSTIVVDIGNYAEDLDLGDRGISVTGSGGGTSLLGRVEMRSGTLSRMTVTGGVAPVADGGCIRVVADDSVTLEDLVVDGCVASGRGGGVYVGGTQRVALDNVAVLGSSAGTGGGIFVEGVSVSAYAVVLQYNDATTGASWVSTASAAGTIDRITTSSNVSSTCAGPLFGGDTGFAVFDLVATDEVGEGLCIGNGTQLFRADVRQSGDGTGAVAITGSPRIEGLVVAGAPGPLVRITTSQAGEQPALLGASIGGSIDDGIIVDLHAGSMATLDNVAIAAVGGAAVRSLGAVEPTVAYSDVSAVSTGGYVGMADPTGTNGNTDVPAQVVSAGRFSVLDWDLHLQTGSPLRDAGDPSISDPDASVSDVGAYCGLNADFGYYDDTDADGMFDGYERFRGLSVGVDDGGLDPDADNLTNLDEFLLGTLPMQADTDADGTNDDVDATPL